MPAPLLTICIPSYNRAKHLDTLLGFLKANLLGNAAYNIDVVVVNNASTDETVEVLNKHAHPKITPLHVDRHRPTVEENIIRSVDSCTGDYVWFLGDDDVPLINNFASNYKLLESGKYDFLLFNPAISDTLGNLASPQNIRMNRPLLELPIGALVATIGALFTFAGVSNQVIRRNLLSSARGLHYMGVSQIYSMVAWVIEAVKDARCVFVNAPLVYYRMNDYGNHWSRVAEKMNVSDHHFWTAGLVDLLSELVKNDCLTYAQIARISEVRQDGARFNLLDDMVNMFFKQLTHAEKSQRQYYSEAQMNRAASFFLSADATLHDCVSALKELYALKKDSKDASHAVRRYQAVYKGRQKLGQHARQIVRVSYGFEIIRTELGYVAVRKGMSALREQTLATIDPLPHEPFVLVEKTEEDIIRKAETVSLSTPADVDYTAEAREKLNEALNQLDTIYNSSSWRLTTPYRMAGGLLKKIVHKIRAYGGVVANFRKRTAL